MIKKCINQLIINYIVSDTCPEISGWCFYCSTNALAATNLGIILCHQNTKFEHMNTNCQLLFCQLPTNNKAKNQNLECSQIVLMV